MVKSHLSDIIQLDAWEAMSGRYGPNISSKADQEVQPKAENGSAAASPGPTPETDPGRPPRVSVIIPTLNEAKNLPYVAERLTGVEQIIVVDGLSVDNTILVACSLWPEAVILHQTRQGKGNALACGFAAVTGDIVVMLDADGSTDPSEIPTFIAALRAGADFAKGSRFCPGGGSTDITVLRRLGNEFFNSIVNVLYGTTYTDLCYGYNAFWTYCLPIIGLESGDPGPRVWGDGFEVETLINVRVAGAGLWIVEVPSFEHRRIHGVTNLNAVSDGLRVLRTIAREWRRLLAIRAKSGKASQAGADRRERSQPRVRDPNLINPDHHSGTAGGFQHNGTSPSRQAISRLRSDHLREDSTRPNTSAGPAR